MPDMKDILASVKAKKEAQRAADLAKWQDAIATGVVACSAVTHDDLARRKQESASLSSAGILAPDGVQLPVEDWISFAVVPEGSTLEAWVDSEGVLDIEVPRDLANDLAAWCEDHGMRVGIELSMLPVAVLHIAFHEAPPIKPSYLHVATNVAGALIYAANGQPGALLGVAPSVVVFPGVTRVMVRAPGYVSQEFDIVGGPDNREAITAQLEPAPDSSDGAPAGSVVVGGVTFIPADIERISAALAAIATADEVK